MANRDDHRLFMTAYRHDRTGKAFLDREGRLTVPNAALCRLLGRDSERLSGADIRDALPGIAWPDSSASAASSRCAIETDAGKIRWLDVSIEPIDAAAGFPPGVCAFLQAADITDRVLLEDRVRRLETDAETMRLTEALLQSEKLLAAGQLAAGIAHEIRNPLTSLKGFLQLLRASSSNPAKRDAYLSIMNDELRRIEQIAGELLVLSKPQSVQFARTRIAHLIRQTAALLQPQALMRNVEIVTVRMSDTAFVYCDENQIKQVLINIVKNGIEAMPRGGKVTIAAEADGERAAIRIADQGTGIPEDKIRQLGQPFYTTKANGTGLGLMVSFKIIENHGGRIEVESEPGVGTVFTVILPADGGLSGRARESQP